METKSILYGLIGFILGGLIVTLAAAGWFGSTKTEKTSADERNDIDAS